MAEYKVGKCGNSLVIRITGMFGKGELKEGDVLKSELIGKDSVILRKV